MSHRHPSAHVRKLILLATLAAGACASAGRLRPFGSRRGGEPAGARILVKNPRWEDLTIYLDRQGTLLRLGEVPGNESRTLAVADTYLRTNCWARLVAMSIGREQQVSSEVFGLAPGDYAVWDVGLVGKVTPVRFEDPPPG